MIFSSFDFIALFLPLTVLGYFLISRVSHRGALYGLAGASLLFYGWWNPIYVPLLIGTKLFNYMIGRVIIRRGGDRALMMFGVAGNILLLCYFKYTDFLIGSFNGLAQASIPLQHIVLPLGISFFTFQSIAYLVDCQRGKTSKGGFAEFALFISFFPQLIAGPIVHHSEMMPQFADPARSRVNWNNIAAGIMIFSIGLFKKVVIADTLATYATWGFDETGALSMVESWLTMLSYTFQIYFDFSGYTDMALGAALMFNITLPQNFNSPYKAVNIREFWRRWHITLSRFLREYLYIPLGGNRLGLPRQVMAMVATFVLGGLWHGASWTFVAWGAMHGAAMAVFLFWTRLGIKLPRPVAWGLTFLFVCLTWVMFRAKTWDDAVKVFAGLGNIQDMTSYDGPATLPFMILGLLALCLACPNSNELQQRFRSSLLWLAFVLWVAGIGFFHIGDYSEFLYFQF